MTVNASQLTRCVIEKTSVETTGLIGEVVVGGTLLQEISSGLVTLYVSLFQAFGLVGKQREGANLSFPFSFFSQLIVLVQN